MSDMETPGECQSCGICVPWICAGCGETRCNWFDGRCLLCNIPRGEGEALPARIEGIIADLEEMRLEIKRREIKRREAVR